MADDFQKLIDKACAPHSDPVEAYLDVVAIAEHPDSANNDVCRQSIVKIATARLQQLHDTPELAGYAGKTNAELALKHCISAFSDHILPNGKAGRYIDTPTAREFIQTARPYLESLKAMDGENRMSKIDIHEPDPSKYCQNIADAVCSDSIKKSRTYNLIFNYNFQPVNEARNFAPIYLGRLAIYDACMTTYIQNERAQQQAKAVLANPRDDEKTNGVHPSQVMNKPSTQPTQKIATNSP